MDEERKKVLVSSDLRPPASEPSRRKRTTPSSSVALPSSGLTGPDWESSCYWTKANRKESQRHPSALMRLPGGCGTRGVLLMNDGDSRSNPRLTAGGLTSAIPTRHQNNP